MASAIHERRDMNPLTTGILWCLGCMKTAAFLPSRDLAMAASSCFSSTGRSMLAMRPDRDSAESQLRSVSGCARSLTSAGLSSSTTCILFIVFGPSMCTIFVPVSENLYALFGRASLQPREVYRFVEYVGY